MAQDSDFSDHAVNTGLNIVVESYIVLQYVP